MSRRGQGAQMPEKKFWILVVVFFFIFPPVSVILLVLRFTGVLGQPRSMERERRNGPMGARTVQVGEVQSQQNHVQQAAQLLTKLQRKARRLTILSGIFAGMFGIALANALSNALYWLGTGNFLRGLEEIFVPLCLFAVPLGTLLVGLHRQREVRRFRTYLAMIGQRDAVTVSSLSAATGHTPARVREELQDMLNAGFFPSGFLDYGTDRLVLSSQGVSEPSTPKASSAPDPQQTVLEEIQTIRQDIHHPHLGAQIDRIGEITARIFAYQRENPEKSGQLHSFLSYYLPTTLKLLRAYARLENQQVSGENISAAMVRIEGMMDKVVEGFEKQLDQLFQGEALDITADVNVLERMLAKDGLSGGRMQL